MSMLSSATNITEIFDDRSVSTSTGNEDPLWLGLFLPKPNKTFININGTQMINGSEKNVSHEEWEVIIYDSREEQVITLLVFGLWAVISLTVQTTIIMTISVTSSLHTLHNFLFVGYCAVESIMVLLILPTIYIQFILGEFPEVACRVLTSLMITLQFGSHHHVAVMAYERFVYFCQPMLYPRRITGIRVTAALAMFYTVALVYNLASDLTVGREFHPAAMCCNIKAQVLIHSAFQLAVYYGGSAVVIIPCLCKIYWLTRTLSVAPAMPAGVNPSTHETRVAAVCAFRMLFLISGTYILTYLPGFCLRVLVFGLGYTWADLDTRRAWAMSLLMRLSVYVYAPLPLILNPLVALYAKPDLRRGMRRMMGLGGSEVHPEGGSGPTLRTTVRGETGGHSKGATVQSSEEGGSRPVRKSGGAGNHVPPAAAETPLSTAALAWQ